MTAAKNGPEAEHAAGAAPERRGYAEALRLAVCRQLLRVTRARRVLLRDADGAPLVELGDASGQDRLRWFSSRLLLDGRCLVVYCRRREDLAEARRVLIRAAEELESDVELLQVA